MLYVPYRTTTVMQITEYNLLSQSTNVYPFAPKDQYACTISYMCIYIHVCPYACMHLVYIVFIHMHTYICVYVCICIYVNVFYGDDKSGR